MDRHEMSDPVMFQVPAQGATEPNDIGEFSAAKK